MRYKLSILLIAVFTAALFTACQNASVESKPETANQIPAVTVTPTTTANNANAPAAPAHNDNAPRISLEDAKKAYDNGGVLFIDTRAEPAYKVEHIKGAVNIPVETIESRYKDVPKDKKIIAYCSWPSEHTSASLVQRLKEKGYKDAFALVGGTAAWKTAGYPMNLAQ